MPRETRTGRASSIQSLGRLAEREFSLSSVTSVNESRNGNEEASVLSYFQHAREKPVAPKRFPMKRETMLPTPASSGLNFTRDTTTGWTATAESFAAPIETVKVKVIESRVVRVAIWANDSCPRVCSLKHFK